MTPTHQDHDHRWSCQDAVVNSSTPNRTVRRLAGYTSAHPLTRTRPACWYVAHQLHGSAAAATGLNPAGDAGDTSPIFWLGGRQREESVRMTEDGDQYQLSLTDPRDKIVL